jgi:hypothetical protein
VITASPTDTPVTPTGELVLIETIPLLLVLHVPPPVTLVSVADDASHNALVPVIATGVGFTVNNTVERHEPIV